jgi:hypothetical protein
MDLPTELQHVNKPVWLPQLARQAKEKSKGTWVEKSLCDLEQQYSSPEDREWLKSAIVNSLELSLFILAEKHQTSFDFR